jgi:hypothetical protein
MPDTSSSLVIGIEEVGAHQWWKALIATLTSQSGAAYMRFVGVVGKEPRYFSATFPVPRTVGFLSPQDEWAADMRHSLREIEKQVENDGWRLLSRSEDPWRLEYTRVDNRFPDEV